MNNNHDILAQIRAAQNDSQAADDFILQYLPFIKSETARFIGHFVEEGRDELSIAMFAFYEATLSYQSDRGSFLSLAATFIRNRLIDYARKECRHSGTISLEEPQSEDEDQTLMDTLSDSRNEIEEMNSRAATREEIEEFTQQLKEYGLSLSDVSDNCPRQNRTLNACIEVLDYARNHPELLDQLVRKKKLPLAALASGTGVEKKTLERHRKYLVALLLAYTNGFEIIRGHLRMVKRKEEQI